jgi:sialate O-acetylesterase
MRIEGAAVRLTFENARGGLVNRNSSGPLRGFAIAGNDEVFHWAEARIDGEEVVVSCPEVANPVAVRYAWGDNPEADLYNAAGLPASPFRTDEWTLGPR